MDKVSKSVRSKIMSKIKSKNTRPELLIRKTLFSLGYRYKIHKKQLSGSPDIVFSKYKLAIFVNGCFWHSHNCKVGHLPKSNSHFWRAKLSKNLERDKNNYENLKKSGWHYLIIWECEIKDNYLNIINKIQSNLKH